MDRILKPDSLEDFQSKSFQEWKKKMEVLTETEWTISNMESVSIGNK